MLVPEYPKRAGISRVIVVRNKREPARRPRGRPRAFDRTEALAKAAKTFWQLGYEGASVADLTVAMGLTPQSLYGAFKSKAGLYREALSWYRDEVGSVAARALEDKDVVTAMQRLLTELAREYSRTGRPQGCMIATATLTCATENSAISQHLKGLRNENLERVRARIERGVTEGQLHPDTDAAAFARFIVALVQGMSVQAKDGAGEEELHGIAMLGGAELARHRS
jgi:AcrR family transcriptional regulator